MKDEKPTLTQLKKLAETYRQQMALVVGVHEEDVHLAVCVHDVGDRVVVDKATARKLIEEPFVHLVALSNGRTEVTLFRQEPFEGDHLPELKVIP